MANAATMSQTGSDRKGHQPNDWLSAGGFQQFLIGLKSLAVFLNRGAWQNGSTAFDFLADAVDQELNLLPPGVERLVWHLKPPWGGVGETNTARGG
jgi:hypothetical protein